MLSPHPDDVAARLSDPAARARPTAPLCQSRSTSRTARTRSSPRGGGRRFEVSSRVSPRRAERRRPEPREQLTSWRHRRDMQPGLARSSRLDRAQAGHVGSRRKLPSQQPSSLMRCPAARRLIATVRPNARFTPLISMLRKGPMEFDDEDEGRPPLRGRGEAAPG
jgi:hypothetical protein